MDLQGSRFEVGTLCPAHNLAGLSRCNVPVVWAVERGIRHLFDAGPKPNGTHRMQDRGGETPVATRLTTAQQFGMQGQLYVKHDCAGARQLRRR